MSNASAAAAKTPPEPPKTGWDALSPKEQESLQKTIEAIGVTILEPKIRKRANQLMNDIINGTDNKEIII